MKALKINVSIAILLFINFTFAYKYLIRITDYGLYFAIILLFIQYIAFQFQDQLPINKSLLKTISYLTIIIILCSVVISYFKIPLYSLNVDRWSVISSFLTEALNGNYPYYAKSHMDNYPGPMPIYFLISLPFYLIGELGILSCIGYIVIVLLVSKETRINYNSKPLILYLLTSAYLFWEIATRSNLFTFTVFVFLVLYKFTNENYNSKLKFYSLALLTGFLLSTRNIYILAYIIFFMPIIINREMSFSKFFIFVLIASLAFISTFIPFIVLFPDDFFKMNPFIIQSSFLVPKLYVFLFILISMVFAFAVKNNSDKIYYTGLSLFIAILIYSIYHLTSSGFESAFINSGIDISYFIFCIPFFIMYLNTTNHQDKSFKTKENLQSV